MYGEKRDAPSISQVVIMHPYLKIIIMVNLTNEWSSDFISDYENTCLTDEDDGNACCIGGFSD